jgi:hypothetical protein
MIGCRCVCHRGQAKWHLFGWCCEGAKLRAKRRPPAPAAHTSSSGPGWDPLLYTGVSDGSTPAHADDHAHGGHHAGDAGHGDAAGVDSSGGDAGGGASTCGGSSCGGGGCGGGGD